MTQTYTFTATRKSFLDAEQELTYSVTLPEDATWYEVLEHFAHFLESNTYTGVVSRLVKAKVFDPL